jgi:protein ImuA
MTGPEPSPTIRALQEQLQARAVAGRRLPPTFVSSGLAALDDLLPQRAFQTGSLVEWLSTSRAAGAAALALWVAGHVCRDSRTLVIVERTGEFYPPAAPWLDRERTILVRPVTAADEIWALDQALRCPAVGAVVGWLDKLDGRTYRRLQLSCEAGGTLGFWLRPAAARRQPAWADLRLLVEPRPSEYGRRLHVEIVHSRTGTTGGTDLELNDEANLVRVAPQLADPEAPQCAAGA